MRISDWSSDVCSSDLLAATVIRHSGGADRELDALGRNLADHQIMLTPDRRRDGLVKLVASHPNRSAVSEATQRKDGNPGSPTNDVDDHSNAWIGHGQARTNRRCKQRPEHPAFIRPG